MQHIQERFKVIPWIHGETTKYVMKRQIKRAAWKTDAYQNYLQAQEKQFF